MRLKRGTSICVHLVAGTTQSASAVARVGSLLDGVLPRSISDEFD